MSIIIILIIIIIIIANNNIYRARVLTNTQLHFTPLFLSLCKRPIEPDRVLGTIIISRCMMSYFSDQKLIGTV